MAKNDQLEAKILQTAEELFLEKGFDATSTTDIARKVGCNQALVHYYYRTKENLFFQIFSKKFKEIKKTKFWFWKRFVRFFSLLLSYINAGPQGADSLEQVIQRFIDFYFNILSSNRNLPFFMINELIMNPERRRYLYDFMNQHADSNSFYQRMEDLVQKEVQKGTIRPITAITLILDMISLIVFTFVSLPMYSDFFLQSEEEIQYYLEQRKEEIKTLIMRGVLAIHDSQCTIHN